MDANDKLVSLSFDEVYISHDICYDKISQQVIGPHKTVQVVMARGIFKSWKQVVFYKYDTPMTSDILLEIITNLYKIGYTVVSVTSDMGPTNMGLWKSMNVSHTNSSFNHPLMPDRRIHVFADAPHLLKLIRNNFLDHGFLLKNNNGMNYLKILKHLI